MTKKQNYEQQIKRITEISMFIKNWRVNDGLSQSEFSSLAGTHANTIHNLEAGKNITLLTLFNTLDAMEMTLSEFFDGME